jgi:hypothetical protein
MFSKDEVISAYTREDAINDGVLVDLMQVDNPVHGGELADVCRQHYKYPIAPILGIFNLHRGSMEYH